MFRSKTGKLRITTLFLSLAVLVLTLSFNVLLSVSNLDSQAVESIISGYRSSAENLGTSIERGIRFGKPLNAYAGMGEMLREMLAGDKGIRLVEIIDADGNILYSQDDAVEHDSKPANRTPQADNDYIAHIESGNEKGHWETPTGYRFLVPLTPRELAGWIAIEVDQKRVEAATHDFMRWSSILLLATCLAVGMALTGWLSSFTATPQARAKLHTSLAKLLLILVGGAQLVYSCTSLVIFDSFVEQTMRTKTAILAQSVERDFEYLIHKGVDVVQLKGKQQLLERLVENNEEILGADLVSPDGTTITEAGHIADPELTVKRQLDAHWPSRYQQRQPVMHLRLGLNPKTITNKVTRLAVDMGTSLVISLLLLLELSKLLGLIASRILEEKDDQPKPAKQVELSPSTQALRATGFVFFFGYDMAISFIPLLAQKLPQPIWRISRELSIGLPISAEMVSAGIALLLSGSATQRYGWHRVFILGTFVAAFGLLMGGLSANLVMLIMARVAAGFGFGLVLMAAQVGALNDANAGAGMTSVFAGIFSGSICGSAAGAMLADHIGYESVLFVAAFVILMAVLTALFGGKLSAATTVEPNVTPETLSINGVWKGLFAGSLTLLKDPRMHLLLLLVGIPASICLTGFLHYLLPLLLNVAQVNQSDIGRVFMLYGLCFITIGPILGNLIDRYKDKSTFLLLTGLFSGATLLLAAQATGLLEISMAVIALGIAQCIAAPSTMLCVLSLASAKTLGQGKTASIYRGLERIGQVLGPILFGAAVVAMGTPQALGVMGVIISIMAVIFWIVWRVSRSGR